MTELNLQVLAFLVAQLVKNLPEMWETQVQSLHQEKGKEKWQPTPVFLSRDPWTEEPGGLSD